MVLLFRGGRGRGLPRPRAPVMMLRHMRPDFIPHHALPRGNFLSRPMRPGPMPLPRMLPPPLPPRPRPPPLRFPIRDMPYPPPIHPPHLRGLGIPPRVPLGPPIRGLIRPQPPIRGRGGFTKRGAAVKRLVSTNGQTKKPQKRKEKTEAFFCETCDRGWNTQEKLQEHVAQHQVCGRDGCTFTAHPKVVLKHTQVQHDSGLYLRISADTDKWIAERKSRFPTKENVEKKAAQIDEMIKRGERMPAQEKRFQNKPNNENWRDKRQRTKTNHNKSEVDKRQEKREPRKLNKPSDNSQWRDPDAWRGDLPQFPGTAAFPLKDDDSSKDVAQDKHFSDDEEWTDKPNAVNDVSVQPSVSNILASLMVDYGSDMSDQDEDSVTDIPKPQPQTPGFHADVKQVTKDITVNIQKEGPTKKLENNEEHDKADSDSGPEESAIDHEDKSNIPVLNGSENKEQDLEQKTNPNAKQIYENKNKARYNKHVRTPMKRHQLSLLEKLLKSEIRHERNVILQCVRYVVKNNFLGSGNLPKYNEVES